MSTIAKTVRLLGMMREYENGNTTSFVWRFWHPLVWVVLPVVYLISILCYGVVEAFRYPHEMGMCVHPYFKKNGIPVKWLK